LARRGANGASLPQDLYDDLVKEFGAVKSVTRQVLTLLLESGARSLGVQDTAILVPRSGDTLGFLASTNPKLTQLDLPPVPIGASIAGLVFVSAQTMSFDQAASAPHFFDEIDKKAGYTTKEYLATPIVSGDATLGVLTFVNREKDAGPFSKADGDLASRYAELCGLVMNHIERSRRMVDSTLDTIKASFDGGRPSGAAAGEHTEAKTAIVDALDQLEARELDLIKDLISQLHSGESEITF
jgi:signal transduction protein with GAF and PtsI domain